MPKSFFLVRTVVAELLRDKFDYWTTCRVLKDFRAEMYWRIRSEPGGVWPPE